MGDMADYYLELAMLQELEYIENLDRRIWTTKTGQEIDVRDMTTIHIENCLKCLEDGRIDFKDQSNEIWKKIFKEELERRK